MNTGTIPSWNLSDRLTKAREIAGIAVGDFAKRLGVSRTTISNYEHGRTVPSRAVLLAYATVTGVSLDWIEHGEQPDSEQGYPVRERRIAA